MTDAKSAAAIAAIRAIADWYEANPDAPTPQHIKIHSWVEGDNDTAERTADLALFASTYNAIIKRSAGSRWATARLPMSGPNPVGDVQVDATLFDK
jgi:hypothetical protein